MAWCVVPTCSARAVHRHHVIEQQELKKRWTPSGRWPTLKRLLDDPRNKVDICFAHHGDHTSAMGRLELVWLPDECFEFAVELMEAAAYDYLKRFYRGVDSRLEEILAAA